MGKNQQERIRRIHWINQKIKDNSSHSVGISQEYLIGDCMFKWGVSRRTMGEYLNALKYSEQIVLDVDTGLLYTKTFHDILRKKGEIISTDEAEANEILHESM
jgi:hypothetical protein|tara:strand:+ start:14 stop:322 length:309 start_codon:yes stop_codon:yes gene_type:complete